MRPLRGLVAAAAIIAFAPKLALAQQISDPRAYCDHVAELIARSDVDALAADILGHTNAAGTAADIRAGLGNLQPFWAKVGTLQSNEHVSEKKFGEHYVRHWYAFVYDLGPMFVRCTMYRPGDGWLILDLTYSDKPEDTGLTN